MKIYPQQVTGHSLKYLAPLAYLLTIVAANWALTTYGFVSVGFGLMAPAGVFFAGLAFSLRDITHESLGRWWVIGAILVGAALSWWVSAPFVASVRMMSISAYCALSRNGVAPMSCAGMNHRSE